MKRLVAVFAATVIAVPLAAQTGIYYPDPDPASFSVTRNIEHGRVDTTSLRMDVYRPARAAAGRPALVFYTSGSVRSNATYTAFARIAASRGVVAILADLRPAAGPSDFRGLIAHVAARGAEYGIDTAAIAVFGASSNAQASLPIVQDRAASRIRAAVMYYGGAPVADYRRDLPMLIVRAGLDRPGLNRAVDSVIAGALRSNAPITVINHAGGHHGFEGVDDDIITRELIDQTVDFVTRVTTPAYRTALAGGAGPATAAAHVLSGNFAAAAASYAALVAADPEDPSLRLSYGEALLGDGQFAKACDELEKLKGAPLGPRDLGLPAARACLQKGDATAAMAWLASIPKRFLPQRVKDEPVFAPLRERADFQALFTP